AGTVPPESPPDGPAGRPRAPACASWQIARTWSNPPYRRSAYSTPAPSPPARGSKSPRWPPQVPLAFALHVLRTAAPPPRRDPVNLVNFTAVENPRCHEVKRGSPQKQSGEYQKLHQKPRMDGEFGVVGAQPASHAHPPRAQCDLRERPRDLPHSHHAIAQPEDE